MNEHRIHEIRKFYLQNLAFMDPTGKANLVIAVSEKSFIRIASYKYILGCNLFLEIIPDINEWLVKSRYLLSGYNCDFTIPSFPELIAFASDYFGIMRSWNNSLSFEKCLIYRDQDMIYKCINNHNPCFKIAEDIIQSLNSQKSIDYERYHRKMLLELHDNEDYHELLDVYKNYLEENVS